MQKYTEEQEKELEINYKAADSDEGREIAVQEFMAKHGKSKRSVVAKLSKMEIYKSKERISKVTGTKPITKEQIVSQIEEKMGFESGALEGLEKAPKLVLLKIINEFFGITSLNP